LLFFLFFLFACHLAIHSPQRTLTMTTIHINRKGPQPTTYTDEDIRHTIRLLAEPGDSGYVTERPTDGHATTRRFQVDTHGRIRFTSEYIA